MHISLLANILKTLIPSTITRQCFWISQSLWGTTQGIKNIHKVSLSKHTQTHTHSPDVSWGVAFHLCASFLRIGLRGIQRHLIKTSPPTAKDWSVEWTGSSTSPSSHSA